MKNKKGFTLVEALAAVVILGILSATAIMGYSKYVKTAQDNYNKKQEDLVTQAGRDYFNDNRGKLPQAPGEERCVLLDTLISNKYIGQVTDYKKSSCGGENSKVCAVKLDTSKYLYYSKLSCGSTYTTIDYLNPTVKLTPTSNKEVEKDKTQIVKMTVNYPNDSDDKKTSNIASYRYVIYKTTNKSKNSNDPVYYDTGWKSVKGSKKELEVNIELDSTGSYYVVGMAYNEHGKLGQSQSGVITLKFTLNCNTQVVIKPSNYTKGTWTNKTIENIITKKGDVQSYNIELLNKSTKELLETENSITARDSRHYIDREGTGVYYYKITTTGSDNSIDECYSADFKIDKIKPTCTITGNQPTWTKEMVTLNAKCEDDTNGSGCIRENTLVYLTSTMNTNYKVDNVYDKAGNTGDCNSVIVKIDKNPPTVGMVGYLMDKVGDTTPYYVNSNGERVSTKEEAGVYTFGKWTKYIVRLFATGEDKESGLAENSEYFIKTGSATGKDDPSANQNKWKTCTTNPLRSYTVKAHGISYVKFKNIDMVGNSTKMKDYKEIRVDRNKPTITLSQSKDAITGDVTITVTGQDNKSSTESGMGNFNGSVCQYYISAGSMSTGSGVEKWNNCGSGTNKNQYIIKAVGKSTIKFRITDKAGNITESEAKEYEKTVVKVTFDVNGGNAWTESRCRRTPAESTLLFTSSSKTCIKMTDYSKASYGVFPESPTKTGYTLEGWYTSRTFEPSTKKTSSSSVVDKTNHTLYAKWEANIYNVTLNKQSGSGGTSTIYEKYETGYYSNSTATNSISIITLPTRTGYTFGGYYTSTGGSGTRIIDESGVILTSNKYFTSDTTLYAKWTPITYTIKYDGNGGTGSVSNTTCTYDVNCTLRTNAFTKEHQHFTNWRIENTNYNAGATVKNLATTNGAVVIAYAQWSANVYKITLDKQEGTNGTSTTYEKYGDGYYSNEAATTSVSRVTPPTRANYTFGGYYTSTGGSGTQIIDESGNIVAANTYFKSNKVIYAKWIPNVYAVTLYGTTTTIYEKYGVGYYSDRAGTISISSVTKPSQTGYTFGGYYTSTGGSGTQIVNASGNITGSNTQFTSNSTIYPKWTPITYTIKYNGNGGTGTVSDTTCTYDSDCTLRTNAFIYSNQLFTNWKIGNTNYNAGTKVRNLATTNGATVTAYAQWSPMIYTITLDKQSGSGGTATIYEKYGTGYYSNSTATTSITKVTPPTRANYTFGGYYTSTGGSGTRIIDESGNILAANTYFTSNKVIYAKWIPNVYAIGLNGTTTTIYEKYATGYYSNSAATTSISSVTKPSQTGHTFGGYYTSTGGGGTQIINASGSIVGSNTQFTSNSTIYPKWTANTYTIKYDKNGGTGTVSDTTCTYGSNCTLRSNSFTKAGNAFVNWKIGSQTYSAGGTVTNLTSTNGATVTAYAQWSPAVYTITLNKANGSGGTSTIYEKYGTGYYSNNTATTSITKVTTPTRTGYTFDGYYTTSSGGGVKVIDAAGNILKENTYFVGNATLYAKWNTSVYTITLNKASGSGGTSTIYEKYGTGYYSNSTATTSTTKVTTPTRTGYTFGGYYTSSNGGGTQIINASGTIVAGNTKFTSNTTIYAKWTASVYKITLNKQNGSGGTSTIYEKYGTGYYSDSATATSITKVTSPTRTGYTFGGYYATSSGSGTQIINNSGSILVANTRFTSNTTIYAKWTAHTYTIKYDKNGGTGSMSNTSCTYGSSCTLRSNSFTRSGYKFSGWKIGSTTYSAGASVSNLTSTNGATFTAYAQWTSTTPSVTCSPKGSSWSKSTNIITITNSNVSTLYYKEYSQSSYTTTSNPASTFSLTTGSYKNQVYGKNSSGTSTAVKTCLANVDKLKPYTPNIDKDAYNYIVYYTNGVKHEQSASDTCYYNGYEKTSDIVCYFNFDSANSLPKDSSYYMYWTVIANDQPSTNASGLSGITSWVKKGWFGTGSTLSSLTVKNTCDGANIRKCETYAVDAAGNQSSKLIVYRNQQDKTNLK